MALIRKLSASKLERAFECPASTVLPQIETETNERAERGTAIHKYLEEVSNGIRSGDIDAPAKALQAVPEEYRADCEIIDLSALPLGGKFQTEVAFAYNYRTGVVRCVGEGLAHGQVVGGEDEITGVADLVEDNGTEVLVGDYKTGRGSVPDAIRNRQLSFLSLCASRFFGRGRSVAVLFKLREDGSTYTDVGRFDAMDLATFELELKGAVAAAEKEAIKYAATLPLSYKKGKHCEYCPSFNYCEAQTAIVRQMATAPATLGSVVTDALASGDALTAYQRYREMELVMKEIRKAMYSWAGQNPIELPDGKVFGSLVYPRDVLIPEIAYKTIKDIMDEDAATRASSFKVTKKGIKEAARSLAERRKLAGIKTTLGGCNEELLGHISAAGGMVQEMRKTTREYRPGEAVEDDE